MGEKIGDAWAPAAAHDGLPLHLGGVQGVHHLRLLLPDGGVDRACGPGTLTPDSV